ncbi:hypothetical protein E2C01_064059 [Portunus trituberculatus]|uniref:Uncharacterized protein n=1 Tax=Portunus trituberculatus TaxID=210409 RepID=A0A5B7HM93_PORTR|nr:hypothetical protein [Portunus trituberculatus]
MMMRPGATRLHGDINTGCLAGGLAYASGKPCTRRTHTWTMFPSPIRRRLIIRIVFMMRKNSGGVTYLNRYSEGNLHLIPSPISPRGLHADLNGSLTSKYFLCTSPLAATTEARETVTMMMKC